MQYARINSTAWCSTAEVLEAIHRSLNAHSLNLPAVAYNESPQEGLKPALIGASQVIPVQGILGKHLSGMEMACGGCSLELIQHRINKAFNDSSVKNIVLYFDSPGGSATGILELADFIRSERSKPIYAFTDSVMASGAYWLAAACSGIFATPSSYVGSIGVYRAIIDYSEQYAQDGLKLVLFQAGKFKAAGLEGSSLTQEQAELMQLQVDAVYTQFTGAIKRYRSKVSRTSMEGQVMNSADAVKSHLVDEIIPGIDSLLTELNPRFSAP